MQPYIEVGQIVSAELSPGNDVVTFTQVAVGVDINVQGRKSRFRTADDLEALVRRPPPRAP